MPDESCRKCGTGLMNCALCPECREVIQEMCPKCGTRTIERFHSKCFYTFEFIQTTYSLA